MDGRGESSTRRSRKVHGARPGQRSSRRMNLVVDDRMIARVASLVMVVQCVNCLQLLGLAYMYLTLALRSHSFLLYLSEVFLSDEDATYLRGSSLYVGLMYLALAVLFGASIIKTMYRSARRLCGVKVRPSRRAQSPSKIHPNKPSRSSRASLDPPVDENYQQRRLASLAQWLWSIAQWAWIAFGIRGERFEEGLLVRESLDLLMQALQGYACSQVIVNPAINLSYGVLLGISAITHPIIVKFLSHDVVSMRLMSVFIEFLTDFVWATVLPLWMYVPYIRLDRSIPPAELAMQHAPGFLDVSRQELRQILLLTRGSVILSFFPYCSALITLSSVEKLILSTKRTKLADMQTTTGRCANHRVIAWRASSNELQNHASSPNPSRSRVWKMRLALQFCGLILFAVSIIAVARTRLTIFHAGCLYPLTTWFVAASDTCAVWQIDCRSFGIPGADSDFATIIPNAHAETLLVLVFQNCEALEIGLAVADLPRLASIQIFDSTIVKWSSLPEVTDSFLGSVQSIALENVTFPVDPTLALPFSKHLSRLTFYNTTIDVFQSHTEHDWQNVKHWICDGCGLTTFPPSLISMHMLRELTIHNTPVTELRFPSTDTISMPWPELEVLKLNSNLHLRSIDASFIRVVRQAPLLRSLHIENTNISTADFISLDQNELKIHASGTPLCARRELDTTRTSNLICT